MIEHSSIATQMRKTVSVYDRFIVEIMMHCYLIVIYCTIIIYFPDECFDPERDTFQKSTKADYGIVIS